MVGSNGAGPRDAGALPKLVVLVEPRDCRIAFGLVGVAWRRGRLLMMVGNESRVVAIGGTERIGVSLALMVVVVDNRVDDWVEQIADLMVQT